MTASLTLRSSLGVHGSIVSSRRQFAPPAAQLCGVYITTGPLHAAKATSGSKTEPITVCFTQVSPQPAQIMNSNGKSRFRTRRRRRWGDPPCLLFRGLAYDSVVPSAKNKTTPNRYPVDGSPQPPGPGHHCTIAQNLGLPEGFMRWGRTAMTATVPVRPEPRPNNPPRLLGAMMPNPSHEIAATEPVLWQVARGMGADSQVQGWTELPPADECIFPPRGSVDRETKTTQI